MAFDFKKEYRALYLPPNRPEICTVPPMNFLAVRGRGDPNAAEGEYQHALTLLYAVAYTIKMSKLGDHRMAGYFDYVVPPLEGLWWQEGRDGIDLSRKADFQWISLIRLPDFVTRAEFDWAIGEATAKKRLDFSPVSYFQYDEGLCVQCMYRGSYDREAETIASMDEFAREHGYAPDFAGGRYHHEIYLSDPRRCKPETLKTVIRHPIRPRNKLILDKPPIER